MRNIQKREKIFNIYSQNLKWIKEKTDLKFNVDFEDGVLCPLCLNLFNKGDLIINHNKNHLTLEHNPPDYFSGRARILTCKTCNNKSGHILDYQLKNLFEEISIKKRLPNSKLRTKIETDLGGKVTSHLSFNANGEFIFEISKEHSNPKECELFKKSIKNGEFWDTDTGRVARHRFNFKLNLPQKANKRLSNVALLKYAYLKAFEKLGHIFLFNKNLDIIREQILNPEKELLTNTCLFNKELDRNQIGELSVIKFSENLKCYLVSLDLCDKSLNKQFNLLLPGFCEYKKDVYADFVDFINNNMGKYFRPGFMKLDEIDIKKSEDTIRGYSIWSDN